VDGGEQKRFRNLRDMARETLCISETSPKLPIMTSGGDNMDQSVRGGNESMIEVDNEHFYNAEGGSDDDGKDSDEDGDEDEDEDEAGGDTFNRSSGVPPRLFGRKDSGPSSANKVNA
jgi:hypothetical protein